MSRTIAVTGATGFAGRHVVAALTAEGHQVKALVRDPKRAALPADVEIIEGDTPEEKARNLAQKLRAAKLV